MIDIHQLVNRIPLFGDPLLMFCLSLMLVITLAILGFTAYLGYIALVLFVTLASIYRYVATQRGMVETVDKLKGEDLAKMDNGSTDSANLGMSRSSGGP